MPWKLPSFFSITGIPPPPAAITTSPLSNNDFIEYCSTNPIGSGEGTTRRYPRPLSSTIVQSVCSRHFEASNAV